MTESLPYAYKQVVVAKTPTILTGLLDPVFASSDQAMADKLVGILCTFYARYPVVKDPDNQHAALVQSKVHEKLMAAFSSGWDPQTPVTDPLLMRNLCCTLLLLESLLGTVPDYAGRFVTQLCKLLLRVAREHAQTSGQLLMNPQLRSTPPRGGQR